MPKKYLIAGTNLTTKSFNLNSKMFNNRYLLLMILLNPICYKINIVLNKFSFKRLTANIIYANQLFQIQSKNSSRNLVSNFELSNLVPTKSFKLVLSKQLSSLFSLNKTREDVIPLFYHTLVRFVEHMSGKKFLFQFYPFLNQNVTTDYIIRYKSWIPRMGSYERRLGHKFFFEEALHIMHLSFILRDATLFAN